MITTYIFDLDDTLVPYAPREARAFQLLEAAGADRQAMREANLRLWPEVAAGRLAIEEKWRREALAGGLSAEVAERFVAAMTDFEPAYPDVLPLLERLAAEGRRLAIISNGPPGDHQRAKLRRAGLDRFFGDRVFISSEVGAAKPDPRIFHHALQALGVQPEEALYVGDKADHDAAAAVAAGLHGVWLDRLDSQAAGLHAGRLDRPDSQAAGLHAGRLGWRDSQGPVPPGIPRITTLAEL